MSDEGGHDAVVGLADELLNTLLDAEPVGATLLGLRDRDERLPDYTESGQDRLRAAVSELAARATALDPASLSAEDLVTRAVIEHQAVETRDRVDVRAVEYTVTDTFDAAAVGLLTLLPMTGIGEQAHADGYCARLARLPEALAAVAGRHRTGIAAGRLPVQRLARAEVDHLDRYLADPAGDPLRRPEPSAESAVDRARFQAERDRLLAEVVRPAFATYREMLAAEVVPHGRPDDRPGLCWLAEGDDYYAKLVRLHTTTDRTPAELHQTGLEIMERLTEEYAELGSRVFGTGELPEILDRLRTDPALRWKDADELLAAARTAVDRAEQAAAAWFGRLPSRRCAVEPVPAGAAPGAAAAYYLPPALDGTRPGTYFANTYRAPERDRYGCEALAFHEAVPGHHFQLALAQELEELPLLRRLAPVTAYSEGWGLYAERLADEMGLYSDDVFRLGMLSADSMRAARLVVDTGLHAMGWDRQQTVDYLRDHTAMPLVEVETEADRYIGSPGQALAYMVGRLEIQGLRSDAERALGDRFDIRSFHDVVLGGGALPLGVLGEVVQEWIDRQR